MLLLPARFPEMRTPVAAAILLVLGVVADQTVGGTPAVLAYLLCYVLAGWQPTLDGLTALRERRLDVDVLTVLAAIGAAAIGQSQDGALLLVIFISSGALEDIATRRTESSVRALVDLAPEQAQLIDADGDISTVDVASLQPGDVVRVVPGGRLPADGTVNAGRSDVDESAVTGEPLPVHRSIGDPTYAGSLNGEGVLEVRVDTAAADSALGRIQALVEEAAEARAPTQLSIERIEQRYAVGVVVVAIALLVGLPVVFGLTFEVTLLRAMTFMVVASPCAIILSTMPALLSAVALAGRNDVLVKGGTALEKLVAVDAVVLDKTGTLTVASPEVRDVVALDGWTSDEVLRLAAAAEAGSEHVLADAVAAAAAARDLSLPTAYDVTALPGMGVRADVDDAVVEVGNTQLITAAAGATPEVTAKAAQGDTPVWVAVDGRPIGLLWIHDRLRDGVGSAVEGLREFGVKRIVLLTGDRAETAYAVGAEVGIEEVHAGLLPEEKVAHLQALQADGYTVLAVGDGLNDAPMLANADCAAAMGLRGSDLTLANADVVLRTDRIGQLPAVMALSHRAIRRVRQNLALALSAITILVVLDLSGNLPLVLGVAGHEGSTLLVALNGLRLLRARNWPAGGPGPVRGPEELVRREGVEAAAAR